MRVVVTGAAGFIGAALCDQLLLSGHEVLGVDGFLTDLYDSETKHARVSRLTPHEAFQFIEGDLRSMPLQGFFDGWDVVVHQAAMAGLVKSWSHLDTYATCNVVATGRLLDELTRSECRLVHISTSSVYGRMAVGGEEIPTDPVSPYGVTKLAAEQLVRAFSHQYGLEALILRYFSVYGPGQRPDMAYHQFAEALLDGGELTVTGDGSQTRSPTYISDCVQATIGAIEHFDPGKTLNIAGRDSISVIQAIEILAGALDARPRIRFVDTRPGDQVETKGDYTAASLAIGYQPRVTPEDGLTRQADWHVQRRVATSPGEPRQE